QITKKEANFQDERTYGGESIWTTRNKKIPLGFSLCLTKKVECNEKGSAVVKGRSVFEAGDLPHGVANPTQVPALEGPPDPLVDRHRRRPAPPQQLVRRDHPPAVQLVAVDCLLLLLLLPETAAVLAVAVGAVAEDLGPIGYVHRQGGGGDAVSPLAVGLPATGGRAEGGDRPAAGLGLAGGRLDGASPDIRLRELVRVMETGGRRLGKEAVRRVLGGVVVASPCHSSPSLCSPSKREDRLARDFTNSDRESGSETTRT
ncbi:unnamed protein product, partial [Musa hybrid cultivar]